MRSLVMSLCSRTLNTIKGHISMLLAKRVKILITERVNASKRVGITAKRS